MSVRSRYADILQYPRPASSRYKPMSRMDRAAQFSPFAALNGYEAAVEETARLTDPFCEADESVLEKLNAKLLFLSQNLKLLPSVTMTVFRPDERKSGGTHVRITGIVQNIDSLTKTVLMKSGEKIRMEYICRIESDLFPDFME